MNKIEQSIKIERQESIKRATKQKEEQRAQEGKDSFIALMISLVIVVPFFIYAMKIIFEKTSFTELIEIIPAAIILIPVIFIIGVILHSSFFTGIIYKKDKSNKPKRTWI